MDPEIAVLGDIMLDSYDIGTATRISPEAPVVILKNPQRQYTLGGAANTAANVLSLGEKSSLVGVIGSDHEGDIVASLCDERNIRFQGPQSNAHRTINKHRFLVGSHQLLRVDNEDSILNAEIREEILSKIVRLKCRVLVISDYGKGVVDEETAQFAIRTTNENGGIVLVDSKSTDYSKFRGATLLTPNLREAQRATGEEDPETAAKKIHRKTGADVVVTLGERGMLLFAHSKITEIPTDPSVVSDVTGAGDTVVAAISVQLMRGRPLIEAVHWANSAAAIAVSRVGTYAVRAEELSND